VRGVDVEIPVGDSCISDVGVEADKSVFSSSSLERDLSLDCVSFTVVGESQSGGSGGNTGFDVDVGLGVDNRFSGLEVVNLERNFLELYCGKLDWGNSSGTSSGMSFRFFMHFKYSG